MTDFENLQDPEWLEAVVSFRPGQATDGRQGIATERDGLAAPLEETLREHRLSM